MARDSSESTNAAALRPRPVMDRWTTPFWEGASRHELVIEQCQSCGHYIHPPFPECTVCRSPAVGFVKVSGRGTIHQRAIVESAVVTGFEDDVPYACLTVELVEQPGLIVAGNLIDAPPREAVIGRAVEVAFLTESDGFTRPVFRLVDGDRR